MNRGLSAAILCCFPTGRRGSRQPELQVTMSAYFPPTPAFNGLTGEQIQQIADSQHPIKPAGAGVAIQGIVYTTAVLCTAVFSLRVWVRFIRREQGVSPGIDDYLAVGGFVRLSKDTVCGGRLLIEYLFCCRVRIFPPVLSPSQAHTTALERQIPPSLRS